MMRKYLIIFNLLLLGTGFSNYISAAAKKIVKIWIFGDSTVKDYTNAQDECSSVLKIAGWGEFMKDFLHPDSLSKVANFILADSVVIDNRANGGRAARSFITGKDSSVLKHAYANMKAGDYMFIQFGHNDEADCTNYPDRCTPISDFKKYIGMYVDSVLKKGATPVLVTPMVRDYAFPAYNTHDNSDGSKTNQQVGNFSLAMQEVAKEKGVACIDLTQRSIDYFNSIGQSQTSYGCFRKVKSGTSLPSGCASLNDGTHFQPNGAKEMARQIFYGLQSLREIKVTITDTNKGTVTAISNGVKDKANKTFSQLTNTFIKRNGWYENNFNPTVKITATPKKGCKFAGWSGDISGNTNPYTLTMNKSYSIIANFIDSGSTATISDNSILSSDFFQIKTNFSLSESYINLNLKSSQMVEMSIFDMQGKNVLTIPSKVMNRGNNTIDISNSCKKLGVYMCKLKIEGKSITRKLIIQ